MPYSGNLEIIFIDCIDLFLVFRTDPEYFLKQRPAPNRIFVVTFCC